MVTREPWLRGWPRPLRQGIDASPQKTPASHMSTPGPVTMTTRSSDCSHDVYTISKTSYFTLIPGTLKYTIKYKKKMVALGIKKHFISIILDYI